MDNKINVNQIVHKAKRKEQVKYIVIASFGMIVFFSLWTFYFKNLESDNWRGLFKVVLIGMMILFFVYGAIKLVDISVKEKKFRKVLNQYSMLNDNSQIPKTAIITKCLVSSTGSLGFDEINYHVWKDVNELIFYPVQPQFKTAKKYDLVRVVRLDISRIRSYYVTGEEFSEIKQDISEDKVINNTNSEPLEKTTEPSYEDTRATIIAYAIEDLTVYFTFSMNLNKQLKALIPEQDRRDFDNTSTESSE